MPKDPNRKRKADLPPKGFRHCRSANLLNYLEHMRQSSLTFSGADFQDLDVRDNEGESILHKAVIMGELEVVEELVQLGVELNFHGELGYTPLHLAASLGRLEMVKTLIDGKAHIDLFDDRSMTPLFHAVMKETFRGVDALIELGANLHHVDIKGKKAIDYAILGSRIERFLRDVSMNNK